MGKEMGTLGVPEEQDPVLEERLEAVRQALVDTDQIVDQVTGQMREIVERSVPLSDERLDVEDTIREFLEYVRSAADEIWDQARKGADIRPAMTTLLAGIQTFAQRFGQWLDAPQARGSSKEA